MTLDEYIQQRINKRDNGCWEWIGNYLRKQPRAIYNNKHISIHQYLWEQANPGQRKPHMLGFDCDLQQACVNPAHKNFTPTMPKPAPKPTRNYQKHDHTCGGIDPVVIDRIVSAGTIEALPIDHVICDCERAYILMHYQGAQEMLKINARRTTEIIRNAGATT